MSSIPEEISHPHYCAYCFISTIVPAREKYQEIMERAKKVVIFDKPRRQNPKFASLSNERLRVVRCTDRQEAVLRLAFFAAEKGHNAVVKVDVIYEKVRTVDGYQTTLWNGTGFAATLAPHHQDLK